MSASVRSSATVLLGIHLRWPTNVDRLGGWSLVGLAALLPFELTQRPLLHVGITITDLKLWWYAVVGLGAAALVLAGRQAVALGRRQNGRPTSIRWSGFARNRHGKEDAGRRTQRVPGGRPTFHGE